MAYSVGAAVGGLIIVGLIALALSRTAFKSQRPMMRAALCAGIAWLIASVIAGFGMADGGPYAYWASAYYVIPTLIVFALLARSFNRDWRDNTSE
jgi:peptidoglycan/LPS O-acetylase OafA/YrhL